MNDYIIRIDHREEDASISFLLNSNLMVCICFSFVVIIYSRLVQHSNCRGFFLELGLDWFPCLEFSFFGKRNVSIHAMKYEHILLSYGVLYRRKSKNRKDCASEILSMLLLAYYVIF